MSETSKELWESKGREGHVVRKFLENFHREDNVGAKGVDPTGFAFHGT